MYLTTTLADTHQFFTVPLLARCLCEAPCNASRCAASLTRCLTTNPSRSDGETLQSIVPTPPTSAGATEQDLAELARSCCAGCASCATNMAGRNEACPGGACTTQCSRNRRCTRHNARHSADNVRNARRSSGRGHSVMCSKQRHRQASEQLYLPGQTHLTVH
jgi:hypothetical protein